MAEVFFILTTLFVAYVVVVVVDSEKRTKKEIKQQSKPAAARPVAAVKTKPEVKATAPAEKKPATTPKVSSPSTAQAQADTIKNPDTGEIVKLTSNYRFFKRWIKEALVAEGLLDKIYKGTELDDEATAKIQSALAQLKTMKKYQ